MISAMKVIFATLLASLLVLSSAAFAPRTTFQAARVIPDPEKTTEEQKSAVTPTSGTYYDDEVEPPQKEGISDSMKARLLREASTGLDSDQKQTNVILYIVAAVALLVILGGQGIFY